MSNESDRRHMLPHACSHTHTYRLLFTLGKTKNLAAKRTTHQTLMLYASPFGVLVYSRG